MLPSTLTLDLISQAFHNNNQTTSILHNITVQFHQNKSYAITGASGTGKSTLLHIIAGLNAPTTGHVYYNSVEIHALAQQKKALFLNNSIGLVFQSSHMIKELTIIENVMLPGLIAHKHKTDIKKRAVMLLEKTGLSHHIHSRPGELSGGQLQRAALARALMNKPAFLIADEPTGNLDTQTGHIILNLMLEYHKKENIGLIISSHDTIVVAHMDEIFELKNGSLHQQTDSTIKCYQQKKFLEKQ